MIMLNVLIMSIGIVMAFAFGLYVCASEGGGLCFALQLAIQPLFKLVSFAFSALIALTR